MMASKWVSMRVRDGLVALSEDRVPSIGQFRALLKGGYIDVNGSGVEMLARIKAGTVQVKAEVEQPEPTGEVKQEEAAPDAAL
jgi:hypothetical protein